MKTPNAHCPDHLSPMKVSRRPNLAGGLGAIFSTLNFILRQTGLIRGIKTLLRINQKDGFDCPGCAWPDPEERSIAEFCENGAKAIAEEATTKRIDEKFFKKYSVAALSEQSDFWLSQQGRLTQPMFLPEGAGHYEKISWDKAFALLATELNQLSSPDEAAFYTSGRTSNEAAFLYQLFVRAFGTNNLPDCSNLCHESSGFALTQSIGSGKGSVTLDDFNYADCIFVVGQNPGTNHPRMLTSLQAAAKRGCKIISINPLSEAGLEKFIHPQDVLGLFGSGTKLATHHLPVRINGDVALFKGIMKELLEKDAQSKNQILDHAFILRHTSGFESFAEDIQKESWNKIVDASGISREQIKEIAEIYAQSKNVICCWAMGLTQHKNAVGNIQEIVNLLLLRGNFGRRGAGACPVRGHSNVQGDRTMGIWERPTPEFLANLAKEFGFNPPTHHGYDAVGAIKAMHESKVKVFFAMGGNFLSANADTDYTAQALRNCSLTAHVSTKLNRSHLITGKRALILPCLGRTEEDLQDGFPQFVSVENSMGVVHSSIGKLKPASRELLSETRIVAMLAEATLGKKIQADWSLLANDYDRVRDCISRVIPGFENFNQRVRHPWGFVLPHAVRDHLEFKTKTGKATFTVHPIPDFSLPKDRFLLTTIRSHDQYNTTIYGLDDRYRGIKNGRRVLFMNEEDIKKKSLRAGAVVNLKSFFKDEVREAKNFVVVSYDIPKGCVATYFPEANVLVPIDSFADGSRTPTSKSIIVEIGRA